MFLCLRNLLLLFCHHPERIHFENYIFEGREFGGGIYQEKMHFAVVDSEVKTSETLVLIDLSFENLQKKRIAFSGSVAEQVPLHIIPGPLDDIR